MHLLLPPADIVDNMRDIGTQTGFAVPQFIAQCIAVLIMFSFLWWFAWKPVRTILEKRRAAIEESMNTADRIKKELADAEATRLSIIHKANEQANALIAEAETAATHRGEQVTQEAARQAEDIIKKAHEAAVIDRDRLLAELKRQVGALVIQTTAKVAGKVLTPEDQTRLNSETLHQLGAPHN